LHVTLLAEAVDLLIASGRCKSLWNLNIFYKPLADINHYLCV